MDKLTNQELQELIKKVKAAQAQIKADIISVDKNYKLLPDETRKTYIKFCGTCNCDYLLINPHDFKITP